MGTEITFCKFVIPSSSRGLVKLNNPLMGTEIRFNRN